MSLKKFIAMVAVTLGLAAPATAATTIIDTLNTRIGVNANSAPFFALINGPGVRQNPLGQSFVIDKAFKDITVEAKFLSIATVAANAGFSVDFLLFSGAGVTGPVLGSVSFAIPGVEVAGRTITARIADFSGLGVLAAGTYPAAVKGDGVSNRGAMIGGTPRNLSKALSGDVLAEAVKTDGTISYGPNGVFSFGRNLSQEFGFKVTGTPIAAVPLPAAGLLLLFAIGGLGLVARRRA